MERVPCRSVEVVPVQTLDELRQGWHASAMAGDVLECSSLGKSHKQVEQLIAGPAGVYICDECVDLCKEIIEEELSK